MPERDNVIDMFDNGSYYTPPCCRPGGRCTQPSSAEDIAAMREVIDFWRGAKVMCVCGHTQADHDGPIGDCSQRCRCAFCPPDTYDCWCAGFKPDYA